MAEYCGICGSKIGLMMEAYEIHGTKEKKCNDCTKRMDLTKQKIRRKENIDEEIAYWGNIIENKNISSEVKEYLTRYISSCLEENKINEDQKEAHRELLRKISTMKVTSGYNYEGYKIVEYLDYLVEESAIGIGIFNSFFNELNEVIGGESTGAKNKLKNGKQRAIANLKYEAMQLGANAIIGIDMDYSTFSNDTLVVVASGTAVKIEKIEE